MCSLQRMNFWQNNFASFFFILTPWHTEWKMKFFDLQPFSPHFSQADPGWRSLPIPGPVNRILELWQSEIYRYITSTAVATGLPQLLLLLLTARTSLLPPTHLLTGGWGAINLCVALILWRLILQSLLTLHVGFGDWKILPAHKDHYKQDRIKKNYWWS